MSDRLLPLYDQELAYLRTLAGEFADAHPKIAGRLRLSPDAVDDPHVARMIEGFALIAARIRQKLDDEFPELTGSLLGALYPHLLAPFPSATIASFAPIEALDGSYTVARHTPLEMEPIDGEACRYRTTQAVELWPIAVRAASISARPLVAPPGPFTDRASSCLRVVLECLSPEASFGALGLDRLRFYLHGQPQHGAALLELLCNDLVGVAVAEHPEDPAAVFLGPHSLRPLGFAPEEALLPRSPRSFEGYCLLGEYFGFPAKFLFVELSGISAKTLRGAGSRLELFFYFRGTSTPTASSSAAPRSSTCSPNGPSRWRSPMKPQNTSSCPTPGGTARGRCSPSTGSRSFRPGGPTARCCPSLPATKPPTRPTPPCSSRPAAGACPKPTTRRTSCCRQWMAS